MSGHWKRRLQYFFFDVVYSVGFDLAITISPASRNMFGGRYALRQTTSEIFVDDIFEPDASDVAMTTALGAFLASSDIVPSRAVIFTVESDGSLGSIDL